MFNLCDTSETKIRLKSKKSYEFQKQSEKRY